MTLVLAAKMKDGVFIGSDSRAYGGWNYFDENHKLIRVHNFVVGFTVSYRTGQLIEHNSDRFKPILSRSDVFAFVQTLKALMHEDGQKKEAPLGEDLDHSVGLLIATPDCVWSVQSNYQFHKHDRYAIGSGFLYAMGYLDALKAGTGSEQIEKAITATGSVIGSVGGDVTVWRVEAG